MTSRIRYTGADPGGGAHPARAPPKMGKNKIFWHKIVIFHTKYPKYGAFFLSAPPPNLKSWIRPWYIHVYLPLSPIRLAAFNW